MGEAHYVSYNAIRTYRNTTQAQNGLNNSRDVYRTNFIPDSAIRTG